MSYQNQLWLFVGISAFGAVLGYVTDYIWASFPLFSLGPIPVLYILAGGGFFSGVVIGARNERFTLNLAFYGATSVGFITHLLIVGLFRKLPLEDKVWISGIVLVLLVLGTGPIAYSLGQLFYYHAGRSRPRLERRQLIGMWGIGIISFVLSVVVIVNTKFGVAL